VISGEFSPLTLSATFQLKSLATDRRHYLLLEVDPLKRLSPGTFRDGGPYDLEEMAHRRQQYEQFLESLGEEPRQATDGQE